MNKIINLKNLIPLFIICYYLLSISTVQAGGLVPCGPGSATGNEMCDFCHFLTLIGRVVFYAVYYIAIPLVVVFVIWGGLKIMTSGGDTTKVQEGRKAIQSAVIGVFIVVGAWLIVNTILSIISNGKIKPWEFKYDNNDIMRICSR